MILDWWLSPELQVRYSLPCDHRYLTDIAVEKASGFVPRMATRSIAAAESGGRRPDIRDGVQGGEQVREKPEIVLTSY